MVDLPNTDVEPEPFRQEVMPDEVDDSPPVETPAAPPAEEPEPPPVDPDWIYDDPAPPQEPPVYPPTIRPEMPMYPPQPQYQPPPMDNTEAALNEFVRDPQGWVRRIQQETLQQVGGQLTWQQQQLASQIERMQQTYAEGEISKAKAVLMKANEHLNKNKTFRGNKAIQDRVKSTLKGYLKQVSEAARRGDYGPIAEFNRMGNEQLDGMLAFYGVTAGVRSPGVGPLQVEGATVESSRPAAASEEVVLTPLQEDIASRMGKGYRERMIKAVLEERKHNDFEVRG